MVNTILKEADLFCPNSVRINFTIYQYSKKGLGIDIFIDPQSFFY
ncbi:ABC transporter ATP-binding protein [Latilactobacillus curvatus]|nr:ABC transporter ATP-binding protein [Latilactobacillus curvatus]